jgi:PBP1b-binding outer membrane lipoprotein LpoB
MHRRKWLAALFVALVLAGCAPVAAGPSSAPNAPYQQSEPRDTGGMH